MFQWFHFWFTKKSSSCSTAQPEPLQNVCSSAITPSFIILKTYKRLPWHRNLLSLFFQQAHCYLLQFHTLGLYGQGHWVVTCAILIFLFHWMYNTVICSLNIRKGKKIILLPNLTIEKQRRKIFAWKYAIDKLCRQLMCVFFHDLGYFDMKMKKKE